MGKQRFISNFDVASVHFPIYLQVEAQMKICTDKVRNGELRCLLTERQVKLLGLVLDEITQVTISPC